MSFFNNIAVFFARIFSSPQPQPQPMNLDTLNALWRGQRGEDSPVRLIGLRGGLEPAGHFNVFGVYDDLIAVIIDDAVTFWKASVDPAPALVRHPINADGAAQLCAGVHMMTGHLLHGDPNKPCLGQAEPVHVTRLGYDGNGGIVARDIQYGDFGICIHSGGAPDDTERFTAGCQIIHNPHGYFGQPTWTDFLNPILTAMEARGLSQVPYLLTSAPNLSAPQHLENV